MRILSVPGPDGERILESDLETCAGQQRSAGPSFERRAEANDVAAYLQSGGTTGAPKGATLATLKEVYSHPQALMQCRNSIRELILHPNTYSNTAKAAADVAQWNDVTKGAIASKLAAELYGLQCVKEHIEDSHDNMTVFVALAREPQEPDEREKKVLTTILFTVRNIPAALYKSLGGFATNGVNMLKARSIIAIFWRPTSSMLPNGNRLPIVFCMVVRICSWCWAKADIACSRYFGTKPCMDPP